MTKQYGISKDEIIRSKRVVADLFKNGNGVMAYPLRCVFLTEATTETTIQWMVSVGKRYHKRAVKRNLIRRRIKEAFRLNRAEFYDQIASERPIGLMICYLYIGKQEHSYIEIENALKLATKNVSKKIKHLSKVNRDIPVDPIG